VGRRPRAADVLFPGLDREGVRGSAFRVHGGADDPPRGLAEMLFPAGKQAEQGSAERRGDPESLALAHDHVRPKLARRLEDRQRQGVGGDDEGHVSDHRFEVEDPFVEMTESVGYVDEHTEDLLGGDRLADEVEVQPAGARVERYLLDLKSRSTGVVREDALLLPGEARRDQEPVPLVDPAAEQEGLARRGRAVVERGVGHVEAGKFDPEALELEERPEHPLAGLGLVRSVRSVELAARDDRVHGRRSVPVSDPSTQERRKMRERAVSIQQLVDVVDDLRFLAPGAEAHPAYPGFLRYIGEQRVDRRNPERFEESGLFPRLVRDPARHVRRPLALGPASSIKALGPCLGYTRVPGPDPVAPPPRGRPARSPLVGEASLFAPPHIHRLPRTCLNPPRSAGSGPLAAPRGLRRRSRSSTSRSGAALSSRRAARPSPYATDSARS